jgi:hypothetical protein
VRYFFHLYNDIITRDDEGRELANEQAARAHALDEARVMAADGVRHGHLRLGHHIRVTDASGAEAFRVTFADAVRITR